MLLKGISVNSDSEYLLLKLYLTNASSVTNNAMILIAVGRADNVGFTNFTGTNANWGWGDIPRDYGDATNLFEIKISTVPVTYATNSWNDALESRNLQIMFTNGENKLVNNGSITSNLGDVFCTSNSLEIKIARSNFSLTGVPLTNLRFFAAVCSWLEGWYSNEMMPSNNQAGTRIVRNYFLPN